MNSVIHNILPTAPITSRQSDSWLLIGGFIIITLLFPFLGLGRILNYLYPMMAFIIGVFLYSNHRILYSGFTWWLWFLTPLARRLIDYRAGFINPSPVLLAPFLVSLVSMLTLLKILPQTRQKDCLPYVLAFSSLCYALCVGLLKSSTQAVLMSALEWFAPIAFGSHLFLEWQYYPLYKRHVSRVFLIAVLVTGAYGIYQYIAAPEWDRIWLTGTQMISAGQPEPMKIRVWSTMHSPGVFAPVMMAGLILLVHNLHPIGFAANAVGYLSFLLCSVRAAWLGWALAIGSLILNLKAKFQIRLIVSAIILGLLVTPLASMDSFSEVISNRFSTFSNISQDASKQDREYTYISSLNYALTNFVGDGMMKGEKAEGFDSGLLTILISLGWVGTIPYLGGLVAIMVILIKSPYVFHDTFANAAKSITMAMIFKLLLGIVMTGLPGMILWSFASLGLAAHKYYTHQSKQLL
jgi:hypothetical protein